jgi:hypothetical protein
MPWQNGPIWYAPEIGKKWIGGDGQQYDSPEAEVDARKELSQSTGVQYDSQGRPIAPEWRGITDNNGLLQQQYQASPWQNVNPNTDALNKYSQTALRDAGTQSDWAKSMLQKQGVEQAGALDQANQANANGLLQMQSQLAQSGGLSGASRERMAKQAFRQGLLSQQNVLRQGQSDRANIGLNDEQNRMQQLGLLQGMNNQQADAQFKNQQAAQSVNQFNIGNAFSDVNAHRLFDAKNYENAQNAWAAGKSADAQKQAANSGGGGGTWICTKVNEASPLDEATHFGLQALRKFTKKTNPLAYRFYIKHCRDFVDSLDVDWAKWKPWVEHIASLCNEGKCDQALAEYMMAGDELLAAFWPDCKHPYWIQRQRIVNQGAR